MDTCPTYLAEIIHRDAYDLGYCDASGVRAVGVWIDTNEDGINRVCQVQCNADTVVELFSLNNSKRAITNSYIELVALVL